MSSAIVAEPSDAAIAANQAGMEHASEGRREASIPHYRHAIVLSPDWYAPHLNLGIALKHTRDFRSSLAASKRAYELDPENANGGALWNIGIAATAIADWPAARWAWTSYGISLPPGDGPIDMNIGNTPIRISPHEHPEVVWCHRIDPARARIKSIPTPETARRYGDLVLHDGEPRGKRMYRGKELSVFDELAVLERSPFRTWRVDVVAPTEADLDALFESLDEHSDAGFEDWTSSLEMLCKACSEGLPHRHEPEATPAWAQERTVAIATVEDAAFALVRRWAEASGDRAASVPELLTP